MRPIELHAVSPANPRPLESPSVVRLRSPNRPAAQGYFSRRELWRLFSLILGVAVVGFLIRELGRPQVAARVDQVLAVAADPAPVAALPVAASADPAQFQQLLALAGWDAARFAQFQSGSPLSDAQRQELLELLRRLKTFDGPQLAEWARAGKPAAPNTDQPGELIPLSGRVTKVERQVLPADLATKLEMPAYFACEMSLDGNAGTATILTARVPTAWTKMKSLDEPAAAAGVFIQMLPPSAGAAETANSLFVSREIAWHPDKPREPFVSLGKSVLGTLGVDVGLLDDVRQRRPISGTEREAFYQVLDAAGRLGANELVRFAGHNLQSVSEFWSAESQRLSAAAKESPAEVTPADQQRLQMAREVQARAAEGRYSVAPLFNDADHQVGELVAFDGTASRISRVAVNNSSDGAASDVVRRFGIDHYYEIDVFTDDSQNNPIVFCVRELPPGLTVGDHLHVPVRIAGFFFKSWSFRSRRVNSADAEMQQFAPLVIGRSPIVLQPADATGVHFFSVVAAGMFVLLLAGIWLAGWWLARADRRFVRGTLAERYSLPEGESLNDLDLEVDRSAGSAD
jgi:hypothetical protein